ncbi:hypothetical protein GCK32_009572 [Trichostrongylus colubriformis]|uniref:Uncharacterized protein n=1 Tax=Trichostrongylus colubriformis TaxID=6319 RepID=A0AAN8F777_TRICO
MRVKKPRVSATKKSEIVDAEEVTTQKARPTKVNRTRRSRTHHIGPLVAKATSGSQKARSSRRIVGSTEHDTGNARLLEGRQTRCRFPVAVGKNSIKKRGRPRLSEVPEKTTVTRKRGRPRQSKGHVKGARTSRRLSRKMCSSANEREEGVGWTTLPRLFSVGESSEPTEPCKKNRSLKKHEGIAGSENRRGRLQKQNSEPRGGSGKESFYSEGCSTRKRVRVQKALISKEQKLMEKAAAEQAKAKERELKRAAQLERRKQKFEEQERKKKERLLRKEKKQMLLQQKRERREEERRKRLAKEPRFERKRRKLDSYMRTRDTEAVNMFISSPCDGILPLCDLSIFWRIFVPGKVFLGRWLILGEVPSHRYGVISYLVVEQSEAATQV